MALVQQALDPELLGRVLRKVNDAYPSERTGQCVVAQGRMHAA